MPASDLRGDKPPVASGFVLVGGKSSRMGRAKALLPWNGTTLAQHMAAIVAEAAGSAALIGDPAHYGAHGLPVFAHRMPRHGPVRGIVSALAASRTEWTLLTRGDI